MLQANFSMIWKRVAWFVPLAVCLVLVGCGRGEAVPTAQDSGLYQMGEPLEDSSLALIVESEYGSDTLETEELQAQYQRVVDQMPMLGMNEMQSQRLLRDLAEGFVRRHLLLGEVQRLDIATDTARVQQQIDLLRSRVQTQEQLDALLAEQGLTMDSLRRALEEDVRLETLVEQMVEDVQEPTAEEIETFREEQAEQVRAQHILFLVNTDSLEQREDEIRERAQAVLDSALAGTDFAELARRHSEDPGSAQRGGELPPFGRGDMVPEFEEAAFALADSGDITTELVRTDYGYHIIRLLGRDTAELMDSLNARALLMQQRQEDLFETKYEELAESAVVRINPNIIEVDFNEPYTEETDE